MLSVLLFLPLVAFYTYLATSKRVTYHNSVAPLGAAYLVYAVAAMFMDTGLEWWLYPLQGLAGLLLFFLTVALIGKVVSPDTVLCVIAAITVTPILWPMPVMLAGGMILTVVVALMKWNRNQEHKLTLGGVIFQTLLSLGIGMRISPDLESVPQASQYSAEVRVIASRWFLVASILTAVSFGIVQMYFI